MKRNDLNNLKSKSSTELHALVKENREQLRALQFDLALGKVKNLALRRKLKKETAVLLTLLNIQKTS